MPFDEELAARVREVISEYGPPDERKMFGGLAFMFKGYMCCGVMKDDLLVRLGPDGAAAALEKKHVRVMDFTGRPMKGYVVVEPPGLRTEATLRAWVDSCVKFVETLPPR